jgi:hypothetical protein
LVVVKSQNNKRVLEMPLMELSLMENALLAGLVRVARSESFETALEKAVA